MILILLILLGAVLLGPFIFPFAERQLEVYLFALGICAVFTAGIWSHTLILTILTDPIAITCAVLLAGLLFRLFQRPFSQSIGFAERLIPSRVFVVLIVISIGLVASFITAIIAAILLVSIISLLHYDRRTQIRLVIVSCYSIGLGAVLTPLGEPLSTIATSRLDETFFYLFTLLGSDVIIAIASLGIIAGIVIPPPSMKRDLIKKLEKESWSAIVIRSVKVYIFVMALTLLGSGFEPLLSPILEGKSPTFLYWANMISAVLDNATLASIELSPTMDEPTIRAILMGLLISGGMLIPGNIPNIIAAGKLSITSKEWALFGFPFGLIAMFVYFFVVVY
ncbi:DUF1646 domain-containing protein [Sporosarcina sp. BI001-red]|uniref:DUF1646 family protein n=1 Tax=Sporosarcina sp. BI001-red TaxID=2282866 RepID=UPI000E246CAA|nr:DUF1646 family protein [Sporosarcina sp. BI001-red]REB07217.1 DUF1646 domain-containing protein [Sporosarcina sp. BI001-red]